MEEPDGTAGAYYAWDHREDDSFGEHTDVCTNADCVQATYEEAAAEACGAES